MAEQSSGTEIGGVFCRNCQRAVPPWHDSDADCIPNLAERVAALERAVACQIHFADRHQRRDFNLEGEKALFDGKPVRIVFRKDETSGGRMWLAWEPLA